MQEIPQERCEIQPKQECHKETKLIPRLEAQEECSNVPKQICENIQVAAEKIMVPKIKKWCGPSALLPNDGT